MTTYTVKKGDSLWSISAKFLGDGARYPEIKALNGLKTNTLQVGQILKIADTKSRYEDIGKQFEICVTEIRSLKSAQKLLKMME